MAAEMPSVEPPPALVAPAILIRHIFSLQIATLSVIQVLDPLELKITFPAVLE